MQNGRIIVSCTEWQKAQHLKSCGTRLVKLLSILVNLKYLSLLVVFFRFNHWSEWTGGLRYLTLFNRMRAKVHKSRERVVCILPFTMRGKENIERRRIIGMDTLLHILWLTLTWGDSYKRVPSFPSSTLINRANHSEFKVQRGQSNSIGWPGG